ncbi:splicing factor 3B subunit 4-like [Zingiber officinale]|uniref:RRM domain-containing protein n=1 Tax=Zingiber officinale TaxID=94328 RepID=A0A8J5KWU6_ZINOF|nr:splicing factor 3B subunit 4-like [Zingiber officinale]XP_042416790.1 splicing factor 3B subunit 4-like [Zingiber officinale]KAG6489480.1 hypothetical protein ZIOFF_050749 [Zingiber officinale]KAG6492589.1 hypothetical protein ZIOFF_047553 [Zingiber officinale]
MSRNPARTVYIGNLDEKVSERVLYEILVQVGRIVDLYIPRDKETDRHRGYAFAQYESEEIAEYAVRLFSGLVRLNNKTIKFAISGQDKSSQNTGTPITLKPTFPRSTSVSGREIDVSRNSLRLVNHRASENIDDLPLSYPQSSSYGSLNNDMNRGNYEYSRRVFGSMFNNDNRQGGTHPITFPSY